MDSIRLLLALATLLAACYRGADDALSPPIATMCTGDVSGRYTIIRHLDPPEFSWSPNCRGVRLLVDESSTRRVVWDVASTDGFNGPVTIGTPPVGATVITPPAVLVKGTSYRIVLFSDMEEQHMVALGVFVR
jgi:hypothetical protein